MTSYLLEAPGVGAYYPWLIVLAVFCGAIAIGASVVSRRSGYNSVRRRARELRTLTAGLAIVLVIHLTARELSLEVVSWRIWLYVLGGFLVIRLGWWGIGLRSLRHDRLDELNRHRKQLYVKKSHRRPAKRRRRK